MADKEVKTKLTLQGDSSGMVTALKDAHRHTLTTSEGLANMAKGAGALIAPLAALAGVASLGALVKGSIDAADNMSKMSQKVGVAIDQLSGMAYAAELADVSTEQLGKGMGKLAKLMYEAAGDKNGGPAETFRTLGISVTDTAGKLRKTDDVMMDVADRLAGMDDGAAKTALAMEVFGKAGADLIPLLNSGKKGIQEAADEAKRFGLVLSEEAGKQAEEFNDNLTRLKSQATGAAMALVNELSPAVLQLMDGLSKGDGVNTSPLIAFIKGIGSVIRNTQAEAVVMIATFDKMAAWVNTGGALGHAFSKEKAADYARQRQTINEAKSAQLKDIFDPESKPEAAKKKGSGRGETGKNKTASEIASALAAKKKAGEDFRELQIEEGVRLIELQEKISEEFRENQIAEDTRLLELKQEAGEAFREMQAEEGVRLIEMRRSQAQILQDIRLSTPDINGNVNSFNMRGQETQSLLGAYSDDEDMKTAILARSKAEQLSIQQKFDDNMLQSQFAAAEKASALMLQIAGDNKAAQLVALGVSTAIAIAQIQIQGRVAQMMALAQLGPIAGAAAAAQIETMIWVNTGLAAASGIVQAAKIDGSRALGGPVSSGASYLIGERGPEIFTPGASGQITSNDKLNQLTGQGVSVTQVLQITAGVPEIVRSEISCMAPMIKSLAVQAVQQAMRAGQLQPV